MSTIIKPLLALLISILLFAGFTYLADTELLEYVQTRFYNPSILKSYSKDNIIDAEITEKHIDDLQERFAVMLTDSSVRSSFLYNQSADDIFERSRLFGILMETTGGLQSVRFVDSNGIRIHFSTLPGDIISQSRSSTAYRNYNEDTIALPYETVNIPSDGKMKFTMDDQTERIVFSYPFFDSMDVYRGTALFTISVRALANKLVEEGRLKFNEDVSVTSVPAGILLGSPVSSKKDILEKTSAIWSAGLLERVIIDAEDSEAKFSLISLKTGKDLFFGRLVNDKLFSIPESMQLLFKLAAFITIFLSLYFLLNMKPNAVMLVQTRIKRLRDSLFEHLYINKTVQERAKWILELEQRRNEIRTELKRNLKLNPRHEKNIDGLINKSWDELLSVLKSGSIQFIPIDTPAINPASTGIAAQETASPEEAEEIQEVEAIEEAEEITEAEALDEVEEITEAEPIEEAEEIFDAEAIEEAEEITEAETIEEAEEITEAETIEEAEEIFDAETIEEAEEIFDAEPIEEAEEITEAEPIEEAEEITEAEPIEEAEEITEAESIEEAEEITEAEPIEEAEEITDAEPIEEAEEIEEVEAVEEAEEIIEVETQPESIWKGLEVIDDEEFEDETEEEIYKSIDEAWPQPDLIAEWEDIDEFEAILERAISADTVKHEGLLKLAEKFTSKRNINQEQQERIRGLLARAEEKENLRKAENRGLLSAASNYGDADQQKQESFSDIDIVSPFSSMFASLKKNEEN